MNINELIAANKLTDAGVMLAENLRFIFNSSGFGINLTKDEFYKVAPSFLNILENGLPEPAEGDVVVTPAIATLTIKFVGPEGDKKWSKIPDYVTAVKVGGKYIFPPYTVIGYTADTNLVTGTMTAAGVTVTVTYTKDAEEETTETAKHTLTITYAGPSGDNDFTAPAKYTAELEEGAAYSVTSPVVEGYSSDTSTVSGTMGTKDISTTVTYAKIVAEGNGQGASGAPGQGVDPSIPG